MSEQLVASGGFCAPQYQSQSMYLPLLRNLISFTAVRGGIDFSPPHIRWAHTRERELRAEAKFWDWERPPDVSR